MPIVGKTVEADIGGGHARHVGGIGHLRREDELVGLDAGPPQELGGGIARMGAVDHQPEQGVGIGREHPGPEREPLR